MTDQQFASTRTKHKRGWAIIKQNGLVVCRMPYYQYIRSHYWKNLRKRYFKSKLPKFCWSCGKPNGNMELHHLKYTRLGHERLTDLIALCHDCHMRLHDSELGRGSEMKSIKYRTMMFCRRNRKRHGIDLKNGKSISVFSGADESKPDPHNIMRDFWAVRLCGYLMFLEKKGHPF